MGSTLVLSAKLIFSEYLRCLNFPLWILWPAITKEADESNLFWDTAPTSCAKFKHLKFSENVNVEGTNNVDSILVLFLKNVCIVFYEPILQTLHQLNDCISAGNLNQQIPNVLLWRLRNIYRLFGTFYFNRAWHPLVDWRVACFKSWQLHLRKTQKLL